MNIFREKNFLKILCIVSILTLVYLFFLNNLTAFRISRLKMTDAFSKLAVILKPLPQSRDKIVIITIDDASLAIAPTRWPWPRNVQVELLKKLASYNPKVITFDISFIGKSENENDDLELAKQFQKLGNCVIASHFSPKGEYILPLQLLQEYSTVGFTNKPRDKDTYVRSARIAVLTTEDKIFDYSIETKTASKFLGLESIGYNKHFVTLKNKNRVFTIPITDIGTILINYRIKKADFITIPFWKVMDSNIPTATFKDKIVFIGVTSEIIHDIYPTPLGIMPGVMIAANTLQTILENNFITPLPLWLQRVFTFLIAIIIAFITYRYKLGRAFFLSISLLSAVFLIYLWLFLFNMLADFSSVLFVGLGTFLGISGFSYLRLAIEANILKNEAITDALTGIYGFRYFDLRLKNEFERSKRYNLPLSLFILDIDHFKQVNDTYGHDNGNIILQQIAKIIKNSSRKPDIAARFGGEEFCAILPQIKEKEAFLFAERVRKEIENTTFTIRGNKDIKITVSIGVAAINKAKMKIADDFLKAADTALYKAKNSGRNKVCLFSNS